MKNTMLRWLFLFFLAFGCSCLLAQSCYIFKDEASGFDVQSHQAELEAKACELVATFDSTDFADSFKVFSFGFYVNLEYYNGYSYPQAFLDMEEQVEQESPYYLLIGRQTDHTGVFTKFWAKVKLPETGNFQCLYEVDRVLLNTNIKTIINNRYESSALNKEAGNFYLAEITGMDSLLTYINDELACCLPGTGNRDFACSPCPTSEEIKSFFLDRGFEQSEIKVLPGTLPPARPGDRSSQTVFNYANQIYLDYQSGFNLNPEQFLQIEIDNATEDGLNAKAYITKNDNFCDAVSADLLNNFDIDQLDASIHYHLWENSDENGKDILFYKFFPEDTIPYIELPTATIIANSSSNCLDYAYPLPISCPDNYPYPDPGYFDYIISKESSDNKLYGYHCVGNGVWVRGDSVQFTNRIAVDGDKERSWGDGGAFIEDLGTVTTSVEVYRKIRYVPSARAFDMAVGEPEKYPTPELVRRMYHWFMRGPDGTIYEDEAENIVAKFIGPIEGDNSPITWECGSDFENGLSELEKVDEELGIIKDILKNWFKVHHNFDSLFVPPFRDTFINSLDNYGPDLTWYPVIPSAPSWAGAIIGGSQGRSIEIGKILKHKSTNIYTIYGIYTIWDNFGVGMSDGRKWYFPGLVPFWVLQHYRNNGSFFKPIKDHSFQIRFNFSTTIE